MYVRVHYKVCQNCGRKFGASLDPHSPAVRVGEEVYVCKCGVLYDTGKKEWANLDLKSRFDYFASTGEIGTMAICLIMPALFGYFVGPGWHWALKAASWGFLVGLSFIFLFWMGKMVVVKLSLRRVPHHDPTTVRGGLPWNW
jgi:hypothetical protein